MFTFISNKFNHKTQGTKGRKSEGIRGSQRISDLGHYLYQCPVGPSSLRLSALLFTTIPLRDTPLTPVHEPRSCASRFWCRYCCIGVCQPSCGIKWGEKNNEYGNSVRLRQPRHGVRASICEIEYQGTEVRYRGDENYQVGDEVTLTL